MYDSMYVVFILGIINVTMMRNWGGKDGYSWRSCKKPQDFNHPDLFSNFCNNNQKIGTMSNNPSPKSAIEIMVTAHLALVHWDQEESVWAIPNYSLKADWKGQRGSVQRAEAALRGKSWPTFSDLNTICHIRLKLSFLRNVVNSVKEN